MAITPKIFHENGFYIVKIKLSSSRIEPYVSGKLETVYDIAQKTNAKLVINTGFFDGKNQKTVSFITKNGHIIANPSENENLITNDTLKLYLQNIYNRYPCALRLKMAGRQRVIIYIHFHNLQSLAKL